MIVTPRCEHLMIGVKNYRALRRLRWSRMEVEALQMLDQRAQCRADQVSERRTCSGMRFVVLMPLLWTVVGVMMEKLHLH
jgi:hypothetical protein